MLGTFLTSDWTEITQNSKNSNSLNEADSVQKAIRAPIYILKHFMGSLCLDVELQSTIRKILFSTVFAFLLLLLGQQMGQYSFGSFLGKELMHSGKPIQTI